VGLEGAEAEDGGEEQNSNGWGPNLDDQLGMMGSTDTTLRMKDGFGHVDLFWHPSHRRFLERPILSWLEERWP